MALTETEMKILRRSNREATKDMTDDGVDDYLGAIAGDDVAALVLIADYRARLLPQLEINKAIHTKNEQETQKQIDLLNI